MQSATNYTLPTKDGKRVPSLMRNISFWNYFKTQYYQLMVLNVSDKEYSKL